jgi:hypothetical protein
MDAYIISYFGKDSATRLARQAYHYQQLTNLLQLQGLETIHILAMDYQQKYVSLLENSLAIPHPRISYHYSDLVPPAAARNQLMRLFNQTKKPWGLFLDNDATIDHRLHGKIVIDVFEKNTDTISSHCDLIVPLSPRHQSWQRWARENAHLTATHVPLWRSNYLKSSVFFLKNRSYYQQEPIYFDEELVELEDWEYVPRMISQGASIWQTNTVMMYEWGMHTSTLYAAVNNQIEQHRLRAVNRDQTREKIFERYAPLGAQRKGKKMVWSTMNRSLYSQDKIWLPIGDDVWGNGLFTS